MPSRTIYEDVTYDTWVSVYLDTHYILNNPDHDLLLVGTAPTIGKWQVWESRCRAKDLDDTGNHSVHVWLPIGACVEFKWVVVDIRTHEIVRWCEGRNKVITVPSVGEVRYFVPWTGAPVQTDIQLVETIYGKPFCPSDLRVPDPPSVLERLGIDKDTQYEISRYFHYFVYFIFLFVFFFVLLAFINNEIQLWFNPADAEDVALNSDLGPQDTGPMFGFW